MNLLVGDAVQQIDVRLKRIGRDHLGAGRGDDADGAVRLPEGHVEIALLDEHAGHRRPRRRRDGDRHGIRVAGAGAPRPRASPGNSIRC